MNSFEQGDSVEIISKKTFGIVEGIENGKIIVTTIDHKTLELELNDIQKHDSTIEIDCDECDGSGETDVLDCRTNSNDCCGGCYKTINCDRCNGSGTIHVEISDLM